MCLIVKHDQNRVSQFESDFVWLIILWRLVLLY